LSVGDVQTILAERMPGEEAMILKQAVAVAAGAMEAIHLDVLKKR
jgi:hypothetical protein